MSASIIALIGYALLGLVSVVALTGVRSYLIVLKGRPASSFAVDGSGEAPALQRLTRVYANYSESVLLLIPLVAALALDRTDITDGLAWWFLAGRVGQSTIHLISIEPWAIKVRYAFFMVQVVVSIYWGVLLLL